jgi:hypothetical protein
MVKNNIKADIEYSFEHGEVINSTLDDVSIYPVTTMRQASFLRKFNGCDGRKLRMDQHCSYSTILI